MPFRSSPMIYLTFSAISIVLTVSCATNNCPRGLPETKVAPTLSPGQYSLILRATKGSKSGAIARGTIHLVRALPEDRSPVTGQGPYPDDVRVFPLYGWTDIDFGAVGAPVLTGEGSPPNSTDPINPGILVELDSYNQCYPENTPVLRIGTFGQTRNPTEIAEDGSTQPVQYFDGAGIGLWVYQADSHGFRGLWREYGIASNGSGNFSANLIPE